jgi:hypothetical protein
MTAGRKVTSNSLEWCTPPKYASALRDFFGGPVELDPCSNRFSLIDARRTYQLPGDDGLAESWKAETIFVNPPYGADRSRGTTIKDWLARCAEANQSFGSEVLALVPIAANTRHWKKYVWGCASSIAFLYDTRLRFLENGKDDGKGAPMACSMVYWGDRIERFESVFIPHGAVVDIRNLHGREIGFEQRRQSTSA